MDGLESHIQPLFPPSGSLPGPFPCKSLPGRTFGSNVNAVIQLTRTSSPMYSPFSVAAFHSGSRRAMTSTAPSSESLPTSSLSTMKLPGRTSTEAGLATRTSTRTPSMSAASSPSQESRPSRWPTTRTMLGNEGPCLMHSPPRLFSSRSTLSSRILTSSLTRCGSLPGLEPLLTWLTGSLTRLSISSATWLSASPSAA